MKKFAGLLVAGTLAINVAACTEDLSSLVTNASGTIDSLRHMHVEDSVRHAHDSLAPHDSGDVRHTGSDDSSHVDRSDTARHSGTTGGDDGGHHGGRRGGDDAGGDGGDSTHHEGGHH